MHSNPIILIPGEDDRLSAMHGYVDSLTKHYPGRRICGFEYKEGLEVDENIYCAIRVFFNSRPWLNKATVIAFDGFGAYVGYNMLRIYPKRISNIFFIGGAPSQALKPAVKRVNKLICSLPHPLDELRNALRWTAYTWSPHPNWTVPDDCRAVHLPNYAKYNRSTVEDIWQRYGVATLKPHAGSFEEALKAIRKHER